MSRLIIGALLPTAAKAWLLAKRPTTATSTELNSCCMMLLAANGSVNRTIFMKSGPWSISTWFFGADGAIFSFIFFFISKWALSLFKRAKLQGFRGISCTNGLFSLKLFFILNEYP